MGPQLAVEGHLNDDLGYAGYAPNRLLASGIFCAATWSGFVLVVFVIDAQVCRIVSSARASPFRVTNRSFAG